MTVKKVFAFHHIENENLLVTGNVASSLSSPITNNILIGEKKSKCYYYRTKCRWKIFIKSLALSVIFSQTEISFLESTEITPFSIVNTYLNIPTVKVKNHFLKLKCMR